LGESDLSRDSGWHPTASNDSKKRP